jgi:hypothetical protein
VDEKGTDNVDENGTDNVDKNGTDNGDEEDNEYNSGWSEFENEVKFQEIMRSTVAQENGTK